MPLREPLDDVTLHHAELDGVLELGLAVGVSDEELEKSDTCFCDARNDTRI